MITSAQLMEIMQHLPLATANVYAQPLSDAMVEFGIDQTKERQAMFLAQVAHESGELRYVAELASGAAYEGRNDLGNNQPGDGIMFKGRGLLQITGRANYAACSLALFGDDRLLSQPQILEQTAPACDASGWFWQTNGLNDLADAGDFERITRRINGGLNGFGFRMMYWRRAQLVFNQS